MYCSFQTVLMRSSQPLSGPSGKRCKEDERLVNSVMGMGKRGFIVDTRAQGVAKMAQSRGDLLHLILKRKCVCAILFIIENQSLRILKTLDAVLLDPN